MFWCSATAVILALLTRALESPAATLDGAASVVVATATSGWVLAVLVAVVLPSLAAMIWIRQNHFERLGIAKRPLAQLASDIATVGAAGLTPRGAGTIGTVAALPTGLLLTLVDGPVRVAVILFICGVSLFATARYLDVATRASASANAHFDPSEVVVDEYAGVLIALAFVPWQWPWVVAAFVLFRIFDITKPGPVGWADRKLTGTWGVMMDDLIAGLLAGLILGAAQLFLARGAP